MYHKLIYHKGGAWLPDSIAGGLIGGSIVGLGFESLYIIILTLIVRYIAGYVAFKLQLPQVENKLEIKQFNPYLNEGLYGKMDNRKTRKDNV